MPRTRNCHKAHRLVVLGLDTELSLGTRIWLRVHLTLCGACSNFKGQLLLIRRALQGLDRY